MIDLSLHILDISENVYKAKAKNLYLTLDDTDTYYEMTFKDDGIGMNEDTVKQVTNPFYTSRKTRNVGLGIPLFKQTLEQTGGYLEIFSQVNEGTQIKGRMYKNHIDAIPLGNLTETLYILLINDYQVDIHFRYNINTLNKNGTFVLDSKEIKQILNGVPMTNNDVMAFLKDYINNGIEYPNSNENGE